MSNEFSAFLEGAVGTLFLTAGFAKVASRASVAPFLHALGFPSRLVGGLARVTPVVEMTLGAWVLSGFLALPAALLTALLGCAFLSLHIVGHLKGVARGCQCFGSLDGNELSLESSIRAGALAAACVLLVASLASSANPLAASTASASSPGATLLGCGAAVSLMTAFALIISVRQFEAERLRYVPGTKQ